MIYNVHHSNCCYNCRLVFIIYMFFIYKSEHKIYILLKLFSCTEIHFSGIKCMCHASHVFWLRPLGFSYPHALVTTVIPSVSINSSSEGLIFKWDGGIFVSLCPIYYYLLWIYSYLCCDKWQNSLLFQGLIQISFKYRIILFLYIIHGYLFCFFILVIVVNAEVDIG